MTHCSLVSSHGKPSLQIMCCRGHKHTYYTRTHVFLCNAPSPCPSVKPFWRSLTLSFSPLFLSLCRSFHPALAAPDARAVPVPCRCTSVTCIGAPPQQHHQRIIHHSHRSADGQRTLTCEGRRASAAAFVAPLSTVSSGVQSRQCLELTDIRFFCWGFSFVPLLLPWINPCPAAPMRVIAGYKETVRPNRRYSVLLCCV